MHIGITTTDATRIENRPRSDSMPRGFTNVVVLSIGPGEKVMANDVAAIEKNASHPTIFHLVDGTRPLGKSRIRKVPMMPTPGTHVQPPRASQRAAMCSSPFVRAYCVTLSSAMPSPQVKPMSRRIQPIVFLGSRERIKIPTNGNV